MAKKIINYGKALYYPHINLTNTNWLKTAALYYDQIYRIVPHNFETNDNDLLMRLNDCDKFVTNVSPSRYADEIGHDFLRFAETQLQEVEEREKLKGKLGTLFSEEMEIKIHSFKLSYLLRERLPKLGLAKPETENNPFINMQVPSVGFLRQLKRQNGSWYKFEPVTAALYMTFLANRLAEHKRVPIVTDNPIYQPLIRRAQYDEWNFDFHLSENNDVGETLASLVIKSVIPEDIENIPDSMIIKFRKSYRDERQLFYSEINELVSDIRDIEDKDVLKDCIEYKKRNIERAVSNLERAYKGMGISTATAMLGLSIPSFASGLGAAIATGGIITVATGKLIEQGIKYYNSRKESPYSYVLLLKNKMKPESLAQQLISSRIII